MQCTIAWFVNNTKILYKNNKVVSSITKKIEVQYGKMTIMQGKKHMFLGMDLKSSDNRTVSIGMEQYIEEAIAKSSMDIWRQAAAPAK